MYYCYCLIFFFLLLIVAIGYWYYRCRHRRNRPRSPRVRFAPIATVIGEEDDGLPGTPSANNDGVSYYLCLIKGAIDNRIYASDTKLQGATCSTGGEADPEMQDNNRTPRRQTL